MLTDREIIATLEMLKNENLDVRTVTLGVSLFDCASHDADRFIANAGQKIARLAGNLVDVCDEVSLRYGIPVVNKRIAVSPIAVAACGFSPEEMCRIATALDDTACRLKIDFIGGFSALVEKGFTKGDLALIEAIPDALAKTSRVCSSVNVASTHAGINMDAVALMGKTIKRTAEITADRDGIGCAKLVVFANIPQDVPFMAGAYLGVGEPDAVINVGVSGPGVVKKAIDRAREANPHLDLGRLSETIKRTAFKVTRVGELIGRQVADKLGIPFGVADLSLAPHAQCRRQRGRNIPESRPQKHRQSGFDRRSGHAERCREKRRHLCQFIRRRTERGIYSRKRGFEHRRSGKKRPSYH